MKQLFPVIFALFVIGQNCAAQALHSASTLRPETKSATIHRAPQQTAGDTPNYWVDAVSYYDAESYYFHEGVNMTYTVSITVDGTDVAIEGLVPGSEWNQYDATQPVHGVYDAEAKTVTFATRPFDYEDHADYAKLGDITYWGSPSNVILLAGNFADEADEWGQHSLVMIDELVFDVNDDLTLFTSRTGYGAYVYQVSEWGVSGCGFLNYMKSSQIGLICETPELVASTASIRIEGINVVPGAELSRTFTVANKGSEPTTIDVTCDRDEVVVDFDSRLDGLAQQTITVYFLPEEAGFFETDIYVTADNGSAVSVTLQAEVNEAPDYSSIVRGGDLTFANDGNTPFALTSDITGFPVAVSTNDKTDGISILNVYANVPQGQTGVLLWKGLCHAAYSMGAIITIDGMPLLNNVYSYMQTWEEEDLANAVVIGEGHHTLRFEYDNYASWRAEYAPFAMHMYVYDLELRLAETSANAAVLKSETLDLGPHFVDCMAVTDCQYVELINAGTAPLSVTSISTDGAFSGIVDGQQAAYGQVLRVPVVFTATEVGEYSGQIVISTTAGDFTLSCQASAEAIPFDYHPIVEAGNISFNTGREYPFAIEGDRAYSSTAYLPTPVGIDSWIELTFDVPAGETADLSWKARNSSQDFMYFMNDVIFTDGTIVEVDGVEVGRFAGADVDLSSDTFDSQYTTFGEGLHTLRFTYHKVDSQPAGDDCFTLWGVSLSVSGQEVSLDAVSSAQPQRTAYNLQGQRTDVRQQGISIVRQHNADGSIATLKALTR